ncbi:MAG TPA: hypothetical protein DGO89_15690, partial [Microcoleaceae bacterium UBA9251]|nr:hypothetical protein [Microcoleaceae cyanobacterium UBA9251]
MIEDIALVGTTKKAIAFINPTVEDYQMLVEGVVPGIQAVVLDPKRDGVEQITQILGKSSFVEAIHIISHGSPGSLHLGNTQLSLETLNRYATQLQRWDAPNILLYSCHLAAEVQGGQFVEQFAQLTGATVYASNTLVGSSGRGGTWHLARVAGTSHLKASSLAFAPQVLAKYPGVFPQIINSNGGTNSTDGIGVTINENGTFKVVKNGSKQVYENSSLIPNTSIGLALGVGNVTYAGNGYNSLSDNPQLKLLNQWAVSGSGTSASPNQVTTTFYADVNNNNSFDPATDFQIQWIARYVYPDDRFSNEFNIAAPTGNTSAVKLYQGFDSYLAGGDAGPAYGLTATNTPLTGTTDNPKFIGVRKNPGLPTESLMGFTENQGEFSRWYSGRFDTPATQIDNGGDLTNTYDTNTGTDNGITVQYDLGVLTGTTTISNSLAFDIDAINIPNAQPSFTAGNPTAVSEDAGAQTIANWATFNPGGAAETSQTATYTVSNLSNPSLFSVAPAVAANGLLTYTPAANANGTSTFSLQVKDDGGTANNGVDTSTTQNLTITVNPVNDQPSFSNLGNQTLTSWTNTAQTVSNWVNSVIFGPANEATQTVSNYIITNDNNTLFTTQPSVATNGTLTYTPSGKPGTATVTVQLQDDGGTANSGVDTSNTATFNITIPAPKVNLTASTTTGSETGTTAITFTATAEGNVVADQTVNLALTGTASAADFTGAIPTQITIPNGSNTGQVTLTVNDDTLAEGNETATLTISSPSAEIALGTTTAQSVIIADNDVAGITITPTTGLTTTEAGGTATFTVQLNTQPTADVTIPLTSSKTTEG